MEHIHWKNIHSINNFDLEKMLVDIEFFSDCSLSRGLDDGNVLRGAHYWNQLQTSRRLVEKLIPNQYTGKILEDVGIGLTEQSFSASKISQSSVDAANFFCAVSDYIP